MIFCLPRAMLKVPKRGFVVVVGTLLDNVPSTKKKSMEENFLMEQ